MPALSDDTRAPLLLSPFSEAGCRCRRAPLFRRRRFFDEFHVPLFRAAAFAAYS